MRGTFGEMGERTALHIDEGFFAGGMHEFKDQGAGIRGEQMEIVVIFTGKRAGGSFQAVKIERDARGVGRSERQGDAGFRHHAGNCNGGEPGWAN